MNMRYVLIILTVLLSNFKIQAQQNSPDRVEPPFWWTGMENKALQLLVYEENIGQYTPEVDYPGVRMVEVHQAENPNYLFIDLEITAEAKPGSFPILFMKNNKEVARYDYTLRKRTNSPTPVDVSDVIYLITPDRFKNGDVSNDAVKGIAEGINRNDRDGRHGGDLAGMISAVDYLDELGVTALWLNPVLENNMQQVSYHGYSTTDYYKVDPRFGSNELYKTLSKELEKKDMKLIMDMIFNHCGLEHWWIKDMPFENWIHGYPDYEITNHAISAVSDPHAANADLEQMSTGWFVPSMPDLNHENPFMATYLIQNSIWWIEYAGLDGIRMDTYPYNNKEMMKEWAERIYAEYPDFYLLGETWVDNEAVEAFWSGQNPEKGGFKYNSKLSSITDFPLCFAIQEAFKKDGDLKALYNVVSKDFLYDDPKSNTIFPDNHDMDRFFHSIGEDLDRYKNAMTFLLTTRGIPQFYYGGEILMKKYGHHGVIREDFPGGWEGDDRNAFTKEGRTAEENIAFNHLKKLLNWRKTSKVIHEGSLKHFVPYENVYVYNRKLGEESVLVIINNKPEAANLDMARFQEVLTGYSKASDVITGRQIDNLSNIKLAGNSSLVLNLQP